MGNGRRGAALAVAAVVAVTAAVAAGALALRDREPPAAPRVASSYAEDRPAALVSARRACSLIDDTVDAIRRDATSEDVLRLLARAEAAATEAYNRDVRWVRLLSAAKALTVALRDDDPDAAGAGLTTAGEACAAARDGG